MGEFSRDRTICLLLALVSACSLRSYPPALCARICLLLALVSACSLRSYSPAPCARIRLLLALGSACSLRSYPPAPCARIRLLLALGFFRTPNTVCLDSASLLTPRHDYNQSFRPLTCACFPPGTWTGSRTEVASAPAASQQTHPTSQTSGGGSLKSPPKVIG